MGQRLGEVQASVRLVAGVGSQTTGGEPTADIGECCHRLHRLVYPQRGQPRQTLCEHAVEPRVKPYCRGNMTHTGSRQTTIILGEAAS